MKNLNCRSEGVVVGVSYFRVGLTFEERGYTYIHTHQNIQTTHRHTHTHHNIHTPQHTHTKTYTHTLRTHTNQCSFFKISTLHRFSVPFFFPHYTQHRSVKTILVHLKFSATLYPKTPIFVMRVLFKVYTPYSIQNVYKTTLGW